MQLDTIMILQSMYPLPAELVLDQATSEYMSDPTSVPPAHLNLTLTIHPEDDSTHTIDLQIVLPTNSASSSTKPSNPATITPRQPSWLPRSSYAQLAELVPDAEPSDTSIDYILHVIEHVRSGIPSLIPVSTANTELTISEPEKEELQRVWFWFPSLSTREKRKDLVDYAPTYNLTGFVLAGKPGLLCLEGNPRQVDRYMSAIKSESWSDIPSYQKKVTERLRKPIEVGGRAFGDMKEITHLIPQYGQYNHRGEMGEVRRLMDEWGVGEDFGAVVLGAGS